MKTKQITTTALLLALCIASQFLKNTSVYITGPIINCILIIAAVFCGLLSGAILSIVTPLTSWLITGSPLMSAIPAIVPCIMAGNFLLVLMVWLFICKKSGNKDLLCGILAGSLIKSAFMGLTISLLILPLLGPSTALPAPALAAARITFSLTQLITALIGGAIALVIVPTLRHAVEQ